MTCTFLRAYSTRWPVGLDATCLSLVRPGVTVTRVREYPVRVTVVYEAPALGRTT